MGSGRASGCASPCSSPAPAPCCRPSSTPPRRVGRSVRRRGRPPDRADAAGLGRARAAGVPTPSSHPRTSPTAPAGTPASRRPSRRVHAGPGRARRVHAPARPRLPRRVRRPHVNTHPALLPSFPGAHAVRDALAHGVKVTGASVLLVDAGTDTGPIVAQRAVDVLDDDDETSLHERIKVVERELLVDVVGRMARDGWPVTEQEGQRSSELARATPGREGRRPVRRALVSRLRQDRSGGAGPRPARGGRRDRLDRLDRRADRGGRRPGDRGRGRHRLPRDPRRPGEDAAPARARRPARRPADPGTPQQLDELGIEPFDLLVVEPLPVPADRAVGRRARTRSSSRSTSAARRWSGRPRRTTRACAVVTDPADYGAVLDAVRAGGFDLEQRQRLAARAFAHTAAYDVAVASWMGTVLADTADGDRLPRLHRRDVGARGGAALRREPAPARRRSTGTGAPGLGARRAAARQGDVVQQLRRHRRRLARRPRLRPSPAWRSSSTPTRAASRSAATSPRPTRRRSTATRSRRSAA